MNKILIIICTIFSFALSQTYCAGDQVSIVDQNLIHTVGAGIEGYDLGSEFKLADWNGALNGGSYHVIFIDMSASW